MHPSMTKRVLRVTVLLICIAGMVGCARNRSSNLRIAGQSIGGQRRQAAREFDLVAEPGAPTRNQNYGIVLTPVHVIAPVGAEVVLLAGVCGGDGHLMADQEVQWMISPGGVGQFVVVGQKSPFDRLGRRGKAQPTKIDNSFAIGRTSSQWKMLTRGTPDTGDDVPVLKGQAWITVTSPVAGTSHVTAVGPDVYSWPERRRTAQIHWVDAQWSLPPAAVNPVGTRHELTTTISLLSDQSPAAGWMVRYEITGGPDAGFAPAGSRIVEVVSDELGQATAEIFQPEPQPGTNTIKVDVFRPGGAAGERMLVASGATTKTWTASQLAVRVAGPAQASAGATVSYSIEVSNPGDVVARDVVVRQTPALGMSYLRSTPEPAGGATGELQWRVGDLGAGQRTTIEAEFRAGGTGAVRSCATAVAADGLSAQDCVTTTIVVPTLDVELNGPEQAELGQLVTFEITVTNRGDAVASELVVVNRFDEGLEHEAATQTIERDFEDLAPGESRRIGVTFRVTGNGTLCSRVEVTGETGVRASAEACVEVIDPRRPGLSVTKTGPVRQQVGDVAQFVIDVTNTGTAPLESIRIADQYDLTLDPVEATDGYEFEGDDLVWIVERLEPGQTVSRRVNCRCLEPATSACNRVVVTAAGGLRAGDDVCLEIARGQSVAPQQATLSVDVADLRDPVQVGRDVIYVIRVANQGTSTVSDLQVTAHVPTGMAPLIEGTAGPTSAAIDRQAVRFEPLELLDPGQTVAYEVRARAERAGNVLFRAEIRADSLSEPLIREHGTTVFAGP